MFTLRHPSAGVCLAAIGLFALTTTAFAQERVTPGPGDVLKVGQVYVVADVTGSTRKDGVFDLEKQLVQNFVALMPAMNYRSAFTSFAGVPEEDWTHVGLRNGNLAAMTAAASRYDYIGTSTPLGSAVDKAGGELNPNAGAAALVVFSDGKSKREAVMDACEAANVRLGENLCIYTVNVGSSEKGKALLESMASVTGCGHAWQASEVGTPEGMEAMVREIFFGTGQRTVVLGAEVLFDLDEATLKAEGRRAIDTLVADMESNPGERVHVEGHTCDLGSEEHNMRLSQRRANAVKGYMVKQGIDASRITTEGYGETQPAVPNTSEANRVMNRRAVFQFSSPSR